MTDEPAQAPRHGPFRPGVTAPAPQAVYQTARQWYSFSYALTGLTAGQSYTVRLDFAEFQATAAW